MTQVPLELRFTGHPIREVTAWLFPDGDVATWLQEMTSWEVDQSTLRLCLLPSLAAGRRSDTRGEPEQERRRQDTTGTADEGVSHPIGAFVVPGAPAAVRGPAAIPYGCVAGRLYVPVDAELYPRLADAELIGLLSDGYDYVWHPRAGLFAFTAADLRTMSDLLAAPPRGERDWHFADPGVSCASRLERVSPIDELTADDVLRQSSDDIGSTSDSWQDLPATPEEPSGGPVHRLGRSALKGLARAMDWSARHVPGARALSQILGAGNWAADQLARLNRIQQSLRNRELSRLFDMLERNPDEGLKYAAPLGEFGRQRGTVTGGSQLGRREVNFDLSSLFRVRAASSWQINALDHQRLRQRYRDLASRELQLGRYRRAAYIFGHLLGDLPNAAGALRAGRHFREAAILYRDKLHQPLSAAKCLAEGGLLTEAIVLFEELQEHEVAGDLYLRLGEAERAMAAFHAAAAKARAHGNYLGAATLLEKKVKSPDSALATLDSGWPHSVQAASCLRAAFQLLTRLGRSAEVQRRLGELTEGSISPQHRTVLPAILAEQVKSPSPAVRRDAEDAVRVVVARLLRDSASHEVPLLLQAVRSLAPHDPLLHHDCERFARRARPTRVPPRPPRRTGRATLVRRWGLPCHVTWLAMMTGRDAIYAVGVCGQELVLARSTWDGLLEFAEPPAWRLASPLHMHCALDESLDWLYVAAGPRIEPFCAVRRFPEGDLFRQAEVRHVDSRQNVLALSASASTLALLKGGENQGLCFEWLDASERPLVSLELRSAAQYDSTDEASAYALLVRRGKAYVSCGRQLYVIDRGSLMPLVELERPIFRLSGSAPFARARIAISFDHGGVVYWPSHFDHGRSCKFASDMPRPLAGFNRGGMLIAADRSGAEVYVPHGDDLVYAARMDEFASQPIAILATGLTNQFAIGFESGEIALYEARP
ncbi:MAG: hypothetical protein AB7O38_17915 [Pirellulaceae bacterium]